MNGLAPRRLGHSHRFVPRVQLTVQIASMHMECLKYDHANFYCRDNKTLSAARVCSSYAFWGAPN